MNGTVADENSASKQKSATSPSPTEAEDNVAKWLAGSFGIVTTVLTALGATGLGLQRLLLNHPIWALIAFVLATVGIALAMVAYVGKWKPGPERLWLVGAAAAFGFGLVIATSLAVVTPRDQARPSIRASFKRDPVWGLMLTVSIRGEHLPASSTGFTAVDGLVFEDGRREASARLHLSHNGPDSAGVIDHSFEVPIPQGRFHEVAVVFDLDEPGRHCLATNRREGCVILRVPQVAQRPTITAEWLDPSLSDRPILSLTADSADLLPAQAVEVRVRARTGDRQRIAYSGSLTPDRLGTVHAEVDIPVPNGTKGVCVTAQVTTPVEGSVPTGAPPACDRGSSASTTWIRLRAPAGEAPG